MNDMKNKMFNIDIKKFEEQKKAVFWDYIVSLITANSIDDGILTFDKYKDIHESIYNRYSNIVFVNNPDKEDFTYIEERSGDDIELIKYIKENKIRISSHENDRCIFYDKDGKLLTIKGFGTFHRISKDSFDNLPKSIKAYLSNNNEYFKNFKN